MTEQRKRQSKGTLRYRGKYFKVYEKDGVFRIYEDSGAGTGFDKKIYKTLASAKKKAQSLNKKANELPWWDQ